MNEKFSGFLLNDSSYDISPRLGYNMGREVEAVGLNQMDFCFSKTRQESSFAKLNSPTQLRVTIKSSISTGRSSSISSDEALEACARLRSLGGMTARLRSQLNHVLNEAYWQQLQGHLSSTPTSTGIK